MKSELQALEDSVVVCRRCPRLVEFRESVAKAKRKQFMDWNYWGKPVPGYGDPEAKLLLIGLAPAAHGGNRTGRVFTGDKSAEFLMRCLHYVGLANQPNSDFRDDGLELYRTYMTPVLKCVPPEDKPKPDELTNCFPFFEEELSILANASCMLALGKIAFDGCLRYFRMRYEFKKKDYPFGHGNTYRFESGMELVAAYHPSPRNVNTGRLTYEAMIELLEKVKLLSKIR